MEHGDDRGEHRKNHNHKMARFFILDDIEKNMVEESKNVTTEIQDTFTNEKVFDQLDTDHAKKHIRENIVNVVM